jgi:hypothetical protein
MRVRARGVRREKPSADRGGFGVLAFLHQGIDTHHRSFVGEGGMWIRSIIGVELPQSRPWIAAT